MEEKAIITPEQKRYYQIVNKLKELKKIVEDEKVPMFKRNQAAAKYLEIERKYFPKFIHLGKDGTYKKPIEEKAE